MYGYYWYSEKQDKHYICGESKDYGYQSVEIISETLGQYIGLIDENGIKVYEGDILAISGYDYEEPSFDEYGVVICGVFGNAILPNKSNNMIYLSDLFRSYTTRYEVLGNIYDNKEE